jgi:4-carboxymuconolactone decarboxylase
MTEVNNTPPKTYQTFVDEFPKVAAALEKLGEEANTHGAIDSKSVRLIKLGMAIAARLEGAVYADVKKALAAGASRDEIRQVAVLAITSVGLPSAMAGLAWIDKMLAELNA